VKSYFLVHHHSVHLLLNQDFNDPYIITCKEALHCHPYGHHERNCDTKLVYCLEQRSSTRGCFQCRYVIISDLSSGQPSPNLHCVGASALQGILTMPLLMMPDVPIHLEGKQVVYLLHGSEFVFPPLNAFCLLSYIILATVSYNRSHTAAVSPLVLAALSHLLPTVYTLTKMSPINKKMTKLAGLMADGVAQGNEKDEGQSMLEADFRKTQKKWQTWSYVRGVIMVGSAATGINALVRV